MKIPGWLRPEELKNAGDLDSPAMSEAHGRILRRKTFLRNLYREFYEDFKRAVGETGPGSLVVELGSGGGFLKEVMPGAVTSDVTPLPGVDKAFSAVDMPFADGSVDAFLMKDVLHHVSDCRLFFKEMLRCLKPGGKVLMIEPANSPWNRFLHKSFHHELFDRTAGWGVGEGGRLSLGNGAIPWIVFQRDGSRFREEFPAFKVLRLFTHTPFRHVLSGGLSVRQLAPSFTYPWVKALERLLSPFNRWLGVFLTIELQKVS